MNRSLWKIAVGCALLVMGLAAYGQPVPPTANNDYYSVVAGTTLTVAAPGVLANDTAGTGPGPLAADLMTGPADGTLIFPGDGSFSYTPTNGFVGVDSFTYQAVNGSLTSSVATVTITTEASPPWFDRAWTYRQAVVVTNGGSTQLTGYQVQVVLGSSFNFAGASTNGSDVRVTAGDGTTPIPFWIESWNTASQQASLWLKMPVLPASATTNVFIYFGNPAATNTMALQAMPPVGPFTRAAGNPIIPAGDPNDGEQILAENMVYDNVSGHYWMVFAHYTSPYGVGLMWSDTPANPASWNWGGIVYTNAGGGSFAPCLVQCQGTNYIFYSDWSNGDFGVQHSIVYISSTNISGPYSAPTTVLSPTAGTWENWRVDEPYVLQRGDGTWIMVYMGDAEAIDGSQSGDPQEQVGYAYANAITGPYTKFANNPVIPFGPAGSYDAGTCADPWVYEFNHTYYIGYTTSPTASSPWQTSMATTTDWTNFPKLGVIFPLDSSGWDSVNSFRGAVSLVNSNYVLSYTGDGYMAGIATQAVYQPINSPTAVFNFYDNFPGTNLNGTNWNRTVGSSNQVVVANGQLTLTGTSSSYVKIMSQQTFGMNYMLEAYAQHPQEGTLNMVPEVGFDDGTFGNTVRIVDDFPTSTTYWSREAKLSGQADNFTTMAETADSGWHTFHIYRQSSEVAGFQIDTNAVEAVTNANVPTSSLAPFLMSYTGGANNQFVVDWIRVRQYVSPAPVVGLGTLTYLPTNEPPQAISQSVSTTANTPVPVTVSGSDAGGYAYGLSYLVLTGPTHGVLSGQAPNLTYTPATNYYGSDSFQFNVNNGQLTSASATVTITVTPVLPVANNDSYIMATGTTLTMGAPGVLGNDTAGTGGGPLTAHLVSEPANGTLVFPGDGSFSYTPNNGFLGVDNFTYQAENGSLTSSVATVTVTVQGGGWGAGESNPPWYSATWFYRQVVSVTNNVDTPLTNYQVQVELGNWFNFAGALTNGNDVLVTAGDGTTLIPFWIESWNAVSQQARIWLKMPLLPANGTTNVFIYYGNPNANGVVLQAEPPLGPFTRAPGNPIIPNGSPNGGQGILAENMVYDNASGHYWMVFANYASPGVGLMWSDTPTDPTSWNWGGMAYNSPDSGSFAPCLVQNNGTNYIFYSDWSGPYFGGQHSIVYITSTSISGPYSAPTTVLSPALGTWENWRVDEPYVFQRDDGTWIMVYMADAEAIDGSQSGDPQEQVGYAYASAITGPYTKYANNPVIPFGPPGSYDAGTCADPWVYEFNHTYYIGYTVSSTASSPWQTAMATTTDWTNFPKLGVIFPLDTSGWDANNSFRGAVSLVNSNYILSYTGDSYEVGIATQALYQPINTPSAVFNFYDNFPGTSLNPNNWTIADGTSSQAVVANGQLTLTAPDSSSYIQIVSPQTFGPNHMVEAYAQHPQEGTLNMVAELGFAGSPWGGDLVRIVDDYPTSTTYWSRQARTSSETTGGEINWNEMAETADTGWHTFHIYTQSSGVAGFQIDTNAIETVATNVPVDNLSVFLMSYTGGANNQFVVDWIRVRQFVSPEPGAGPAQLAQTINFGSLANQTYGNAPFTVTATSSSGLPVTFSIVSGPATISGNTITIMGAGAVTVQASQAGDANYQGAATVYQTFTVLPANSLNALTFSMNPALPGANVVFTATISGVTTPTGTVQFKANGVAFGSAVMLNGSGVATISNSSLPHGNNAITAEYSGDANFLSSTGSLNEVVDTPPKSATHFLGTPMNTPLSIAAGTLAALDYDADGDALAIAAVSSTSSNGPAGNVTFTGGTNITYTPMTGYVGSDLFTYAVSDGYSGGTVTNSAVVTVRLASGATNGFNYVSAPVGGSVTLRGYGTPGNSYQIQESGDLVNWTTIGTTNALPNGLILFTDVNATNSPRYYRLATP